MGKRIRKISGAPEKKFPHFDHHSPQCTAKTTDVGDGKNCRACKLRIASHQIPVNPAGVPDAKEFLVRPATDMNS